MIRYCAICNHCGHASAWNRDLGGSEKEIRAHLADRHKLSAPGAADYRVVSERQCDYCLKPYLDHCTKCSQDFCVLHAGDIDGLCGGCI